MCGIPGFPLFKLTVATRRTWFAEAEDTHAVLEGWMVAVRMNAHSAQKRLKLTEHVWSGLIEVANQQMNPVAKNHVGIHLKNHSMPQFVSWS